MRAVLVDDMLLLGSTDQGRHAIRDLPMLVAGAALADLARSGRLSCAGRGVMVEDATATGHPALDVLLARIAAARRPRAPWRWVFDSARPLIRVEREHLVELGVLGIEQDTVLGMLPRTRFPLLDATRHRDVVERVRRVVLADDSTDDDTRMLISLLGTAFHKGRTAASLFPELDAVSLRRRFHELSMTHWSVTGTARAVTLANGARA